MAIQREIQDIYFPCIIHVIYIHTYPIYTLKGVALGLDPCKGRREAGLAQGEAGRAL